MEKVIRFNGKEYRTESIPVHPEHYQMVDWFRFDATGRYFTVNHYEPLTCCDWCIGGHVIEETPYGIIQIASFDPFFPFCGTHIRVGPYCFLPERSVRPSQLKPCNAPAFIDSPTDRWYRKPDLNSYYFIEVDGPTYIETPFGVGYLMTKGLVMVIASKWWLLEPLEE